MGSVRCLRTAAPSTNHVLEWRYGPELPRSHLLQVPAGSGKMANEIQTSAKGPEHTRTAHQLDGKPFAREHSDLDRRSVRPATIFLEVNLARSNTKTG